MQLLKSLFADIRSILTYGLLLAGVLFLLKWLEWNLLIRDHVLDLYIGGIAVTFTLLGLWLARQLAKTVQKPTVEAAVPLSISVAELAVQFELTNREGEVLQQLLQGKSNAEIANQLFLSLSTVKTHISNLFLKMDVKSRTQAMEKARRLGLTEKGA